MATRQDMTKEVTQVIIKSYLAVWKDEPALKKLNEIAETCIESVIYPYPPADSIREKLDEGERVIADEIAIHIENAIDELQNPPYKGDGFEPINDTIVETS